MSQSITPVYVVLGLPSRNKDILTYSKCVLSGLTNNPHFPTPNPTLAVFSADITAFDVAETAAAGKAVGATSARNAKKTRVVQDLRHLRDYVQGVGEILTSDAVSVVESSGFRVRRLGTHHKQVLASKDGATSGSVLLVAKAVARSATYYWQYSPDGKTWTSCPDTMKASITISGLTAGQTYAFRFRALTRAGASDFSQVVAHMVR